MSYWTILTVLLSAPGDMTTSGNFSSQQYCIRALVASIPPDTPFDVRQCVLVINERK